MSIVKHFVLYTGVIDKTNPRGAERNEIPSNGWSSYLVDD